MLRYRYQLTPGPERTRRALVALALALSALAGYVIGGVAL